MTSIGSNIEYPNIYLQ